MRLINAVLLALLVGLASACASAPKDRPANGALLLDLCESNAEADQTRCADLIGNSLNGVQRTDCYFHPSGDLRDQATRDVVVGYLRRHPENRNAGVTETVQAAFRESFPC